MLEGIERAEAAAAANWIRTEENLSARKDRIRSSSAAIASTSITSAAATIDRRIGRSATATAWVDHRVRRVAATAAGINSRVRRITAAARIANGVRWVTAATSGITGSVRRVATASGIAVVMMEPIDKAVEPAIMVQPIN